MTANVGQCTGPGSGTCITPVCVGWAGLPGRAGLGWQGWQGWIGGLGWVTVTRKLKQEILWEESWIGAGYHQQIFRSLAHTEEEGEELKI